MLAHADDYLPEALDAARKELGRRNLAPERATVLQANAQSAVAREIGKADEPLEWSMRVLVFALGFCPAIFFGLYYQSKGYTRKAKEAWYCSIAGFLFVLFLGIVGAVAS